MQETSNLSFHLSNPFKFIARFTRYTVRTNCLFHLHVKGLNSTFLARNTCAKCTFIALSTKSTRVAAQSIRKVFSRKYLRLHTSLSERISTRCCITNNLRQLPFVILQNVKVFSLRWFAWKLCLLWKPLSTSCQFLG